MIKYLKKLPQEIQELLHLFSDIAYRDNMPIYLVGGIVRDLILGVNNLDLDIVVEGDGIKFAECCASVLKARLMRHSRFGTATLIVNPKLKVDVATARRELYPQPASLPVVTPGTLRDDLGRRDFTINAMAISIIKRDFGRLVDFFGGRSDLVHRRIRTLHALSFIDDPTRILRAIRFERRYNFKIEAETLSYLKQAIRLRMLEKVHPHRLRDELILVLKEGEPLRQIKRIKTLAGFVFISPRLSVSQVTHKHLSSIKRCVDWIKKDYPKRRELDVWLIYFMGLVDSLSLKDTQVICGKFAFPRGDEKRILSYKKLKPAFIRELRQLKIKPSRIFGLLEPLSYEVIILIKAKDKNRYLQKNIEDFFQIYNGMRVCICGDDLRRMGIRPGPYYQKIFTRVLKEKLEGKIKTKEQELALMRKMARG